jgi:putative transposase
MAFVVDAFARRILDWRTGSSVSPTGTERSGTSGMDPPAGRSITRFGCGHRDRDSQYTSIRYTERLVLGRTAACVGSVGDSYDNALAETINGLYKTELIKPRGPWRTVDAVEYATAAYVEWFNHRRVYEHCGDVPPVDLENAYYVLHRVQPPAAVLSNQ